MLEWCSISVRTITSPEPTFAPPHEYATRFRASVAFRVKTVSPGEEPTSLAAAMRAASKASVARAASGYTPRWIDARYSR
jgi:hypothetical protein